MKTLALAIPGIVVMGYVALLTHGLFSTIANALANLPLVR